MIQPDTVPPVPPEGILLKRAREGRRTRKMSMRAAARAADVSETTWRHAEAGSEPKGSLRLPYRVGDATLARMALTVGVTSAELREAGRGEAAAILDEMGRRPADAEDVADAVVAVLKRALLPGENIIRESDLDPQFASDLIVALRGEDVPDLIVSLVESRRRARRGSGS